MGEDRGMELGMIRGRQGREYCLFRPNKGHNSNVSVTKNN